MKIFNNTKIKELEALVEQGYINKRKHSSANIYIYNYTKKTQYKHNWDGITNVCRGLILDEDYNIVARPFSKFFNLEEEDFADISLTPFKIFEKLDGSLGILYWVGDTPYIATRGSFSSKQALKATKILHDKYQHTYSKIDRSKTYLFEIIYPENRIVVDYGKLEDLILLAIVDNKTGVDYLENVGFPLVKEYDYKQDIGKIYQKQLDGKEGYVLKFDNNFRVKIKFEEYKRLHKVLVSISTTKIWEMLKNNENLHTVLDHVPNEIFKWVEKEVEGLRAKYKEVEEECKTAFRDYGDRKATAFYFKTQKYSSVLFAMLDNRDSTSLIWDIIKPEFQTPFTQNYEKSFNN